MRLLSLITLFVPCLALATPKVNLAVCFFMRNNADQKWEQYGSSGSSRYFDLPENQRKLHYGFWTAQEGH